MNLSNFIKHQQNLLTIYFTAGYPELEDTARIIEELSSAGVGMIEVGLPFSDSLVDGLVIQQSNKVALVNGMSLKKLFLQLSAAKDNFNPEVPLIFMGSINPLMQYGMEKFVKDAVKSKISGAIIPDMSPEVYEAEYKDLFEANNLATCFLVSPHTPEERIHYIDSLTTGFIYAVSSDATTGDKLSIDQNKKAYYQKLKDLNLANPFLIGFGIRDRESFLAACEYGSGGIIGSDFIRCLSEKKDIKEYCQGFLAHKSGHLKGH